MLLQEFAFTIAMVTFTIGNFAITGILIKEYNYNVFTLRFVDQNSHELQENVNIYIWLFLMV